MKLFTTLFILLTTFSTLAKADYLTCPTNIQVTNPDFTSDTESQALNALLIKKGYFSDSTEVTLPGVALEITSELWANDHHGKNLETTRSTQGKVLWSLVGEFQYKAKAAFTLSGQTQNSLYSSQETVPYLTGFLPVERKKNYTSNGWWDTEQTSYQLEKGLNDSLHWKQAFKKLMQKLERELPSCEDLSANQ